MSNQVYENDKFKYINYDILNFESQFSGSGPVEPFQLNLSGPWISNQVYVISYRVTQNMVTLFLPSFLVSSDNNSASIDGVNVLPSKLLIPAGGQFWAPMTVISQGNILNGTLNINMSTGAVKFFISPSSAVFVAASNVGLNGCEINYYLH